MKNQRTVCICLLAYAGFMRSDEVLKLRRCDFVINSVYMCVFIESSKTDKYRDGAWLLIARTGSNICPVVNIERYFTWANISPDSECYIFRQLSATKTGYVLKKILNI